MIVNRENTQSWWLVWVGGPAPGLTRLGLVNYSFQTCAASNYSLQLSSSVYTKLIVYIVLGYHKKIGFAPIALTQVIKKVFQDLVKIVKVWSVVWRNSLNSKSIFFHKVWWNLVWKVSQYSMFNLLLKILELAVSIAHNSRKRLQETNWKKRAKRDERKGGLFFSDCDNSVTSATNKQC